MLRPSSCPLARSIVSLAALSAAALSLSVVSVQATPWNLTTSIAANEFFNTFDFFNETDPTNGLVNYASKDTAQSQNLSFVQNDLFYMKVDDVNQAPSGRGSVRISSQQSYEDGVYVLNVSHVPIGCSAWPAFWTVTEDLDNWPTGGEIDIMENANDQYNYNLVSLHTKSSCTIPNSISTQSGAVAYSNCSAYTEANEGCRVGMNGTSSPTWGAALNAAGGGIIAMERALGKTGAGIRVWLWNQGASLPSDLAAGSQEVDTSGWGTPAAHFPIANECPNDFGKHKITFDITLCGDWAANTYEASGCAATYSACSAQVNYNASSYNQTYWAVHDLRVFATGGGTDNAAEGTSVDGAARVFGGIGAVMMLSAAFAVALAALL